MGTRDEILTLDRRHVWRPYTSSDDHQGRDPIVVARAEGARLFDHDGRSYLDANGSWWVNNLGHGHPRLRAALVKQLETLAHCSMAGMTHEPAARLAAELVAVAPAGLTRVFFSDDGSTAVEVALKIAFQHALQTGRRAQRFLALGAAYHGDTTGAMSVGRIPEFHATFGPMLFDVVHASVERGFDAAFAEIEARLVSEGSSIAAVVVEPLVQGAAGMRMYPPALLARLREATQRAGVLLIVDEVFTGYGRTGAMWACELAGISPDLMCTAKGFSGGILPFAATLATDAVFDAFSGDGTRALMHGHSFCGNPLGAAIAREVLAVYRDEGVLGEVAAKAPRIAEAFERMGRIAGTARPRALGMIGAIDLGGAGYHARLGRRAQDAARERGVSLRPLGDTVYVAPPLTITGDELDELLRVVSESVRIALER